MNWSNVTCPVTDEPAREIAQRIGDSIDFVCPTCGHFRATASAIEMMSSLPKVVRQAALQRAIVRSGMDGSMPPITTGDLP